MPHRPSLARPGVALAALAVLALGARCPLRTISADPAVQGASAPVFVSAPAGDPRLFVVERAGRIRIADPTSGAIQEPPFLDIRSRVDGGGEGGLLGLAFAPDFAASGRFYVYFLELGSFDSIVARFTLADPADPVADPASEEIVLRVEQPASNHNGGTLAFSPLDGMLYFGLGDGGGSDDAFGTAQNPDSLLGKMLRLDVSGAGPGYAIPADNPFVGDDGVRDEIWAFGLRNPFRFAFDRETGDLWIADVGQGQREEVNLEAAGDGGGNYGWPVHEGSVCYRPNHAAGPCETPGQAARFRFPVAEYDHSLGCSITGGTPYRGAGRGWQGWYFYADYCTERFWGFHPGNPPADMTAAFAGMGVPFAGITGISEDGFGELYLSNLANGVVHRLNLDEDAAAE
jgi:glucose/arabinose dehydrogenase